MVQVCRFLLTAGQIHDKDGQCRPACGVPGWLHTSVLGITDEGILRSAGLFFDIKKVFTIIKVMNQILENPFPYSSDNKRYLTFSWYLKNRY